MLSKMAQPNNVGGGGGATATSGRRVPMSLSGAPGTGSSASRVQQSSASNGTSKSSQNSNTIKKSELISGEAPFVQTKKLSHTQHRSQNTPSTSAPSSAPKDDEKKTQNGKSSNSNQKSSQNGSSNSAVKDQQKHKEKKSEKKDSAKVETKEEPKVTKIEPKTITVAAAQSAEAKKMDAATEIIDLDADELVVPVPKTPTSERKSIRKSVNSSEEKVPEAKAEITVTPSSKKQTEEVEKKPDAVEDVEMEPLAVETSPVRNVPSAQPTATSTPGRNLFGFRSNTKQSSEVELAAQPSSSPVSVPARSFAQISGRRSIRPNTTLTPGKLGHYRCVNSDLDTSSCTNTSMNATAGSEIPNSSSFSFSFFGRGRKRERTPPPLTGSQSANDLAQDVEMSPPKRARFDIFSMNLASPFTMLRTRFSKTTISTPSSRQQHEQTPPAGVDEERDEVQNVSGIINQEEEQKLNKSSASNEISVAQEAGLETPKKSGSPVKETEKDESKKEEQGEDAVANLPAENTEVGPEGDGPNRSRCAIM